MSQKYLDDVVTGFKSVDKNMKCCGQQFTLGEWVVCDDDDVDKCSERGLYFHEHQGGAWVNCNILNPRVFKVEARYVFDLPRGPGTEHKLVCRELRLVEEVSASGSRNTGSGNIGNNNSGNHNTGNYNVGGYNAGDSNVGYWNIGDWNAGDSNTGLVNAGNSNIGDFNAGNWNVGSNNAGDTNVGNENAGHGNTGDNNTGSGNYTNGSSGMFCTVEPTIMSFDVDSGLTRQEYITKYPHYRELADEMLEDDEIPFERFADIPGITPEKLKLLHDKHKQARKDRR